MTGKERRYLKKLAHDLDPSVTIGKNGISDSLIEQIDQVLEKRELIKIKVLKNNIDDRDVLIREILEETGAEFVQHIGSIITIYRPSKEKKIEITND